MGDIIGGIIGGVGSLIGGAASNSADQAAAKQALTGYNYLNKDPLINQLQTNAGTASTGEANTTGAINSLLTSPDQNSPAFKNYLNSTGYNFQLQQGQDAITGNAASKGLLNSGATGKALVGYGNNLAAGSFNNYLGQLSGVAQLQGQQVGQGLTAAQAVGQAGTAGGGNAGQQTAAGGTALANGLTTAAGSFGSAASNYFAQPAPTPVPF